MSHDEHASEDVALDAEWKPVEFELWDGQNYAKGFYRVRFGGREAWAHPNAGVMNLFSEDGTHSTNEIVGPGKCEARWADKEHRQMLRLQRHRFRKMDPIDKANLMLYGPKQQTVRRLLPKVGRNEPCPCGSGSKHKRCCLRKEAA